MANVTLPLDHVSYSRNGVVLRNVAVDENVLARRLPTTKSFTVVSQSVHDGSTVLRGTTVDVNVAVTWDLPLEIFPNVPERWQKILIGDVATKVRREPEILKLLGDHQDITTLNEAELKDVVTFMEHAGLAGGDPATGFRVLVNAHTLAGEG